MDLFARIQELKALFSYRERALSANRRLALHPFRFTPHTGLQEIRHLRQAFPTTAFCPLADDRIVENKSFPYIIFAPDGKAAYDRAIVLLHGLNERSWDKYLPWAGYLAEATGHPVILFPLAFHMNRTPVQWRSPRSTLPWANERKQRLHSGANGTTFVNVVLSTRIEQQPLRFYASGLESTYNLVQLVREMKDGEHPLFRAGASVHLFAYSVGALLAQVVLLANPEQLFSDARLFMFCGGSVFSDMNANARDILDKEANDCLHRYYAVDFPADPSVPDNPLVGAFKMMLHPDTMKARREALFRCAAHRIRAISLQLDTVVPTAGIRKALGAVSERTLQELHFPFHYSHQIPFPIDKRIEPALLSAAFASVFEPAAAFFN
jgi:pimeloyl-ACP methyl ester carboxylesterase